jgi:hypothetical protein
VGKRGWGGGVVGGEVGRVGTCACLCAWRARCRQVGRQIGAGCRVRCPAERRRRTPSTGAACVHMHGVCLCVWVGGWVGVGGGGDMLVPT